MAHRRADARQFVGGDGCANAAATDEHPHGLPGLAGPLYRQPLHSRIIHRILIHGAEVDHRVAQFVQIVAKLLFERESGVIRTDCDGIAISQ